MKSIGIASQSTFQILVMSAARKHSTLVQGGRVYSSQPWVRLRDYRFRGGVTWEILDERVTQLVGTSAVAIPSVRVAALWVLEFLGLTRHRDEILVPQYLGRCILNTLGRRALPVQFLSPRTKIALVVHQFGFLQQLPTIENELAKLNISYLEDSPARLDFQEKCGGQSLGRLVALSKLLPLVKGGVFISTRQDLLEFIRTKRNEESIWSWVILLGLAYSRAQQTAPLHVGWMDAIYELYPLSSADNKILRNNFWDGLSFVESYQRITERRLEFIRKHLGQRALLPEFHRLAALVPFVADGIEEKVRHVLTRYRLDSTQYHFDERANLLDPGHRLVFLIPLNPAIPQSLFESLVSDLSRV